MADYTPNLNLMRSYATDLIDPVTNLDDNWDKLDIVWGNRYSEGTLASRPSATTKKPGDAYFATDVNGGTLYKVKAGSPQTWTQVTVGLNPPGIFQADFAGTNVAGTLPLTSPIAYPFFTSDTYGIFTAEDDEAIVTVEINGAVIGLAWVPIDFYYALTSVTGQLTPSVQGQALAAGVTKVKGGSLGASVMGPTAKTSRFKLTGLTPGQTYRWEISAAVTGVRTDEPTGTTGNKVAISKIPDADAFFRAVVRNDGASTASIFKVSGLSSTGGDLVKTWGSPITLPASAGATTGHVTITDDGTKAFVANQTDNSVTVITLPADGTTAPSGTNVAVTGQPYALALTPDMATLWIGQATGQKFIPMRVSTNALGTASATTGRTIIAMAINPAGTKLIASNFGSGLVDVFSIAGSNGWPTSPTATSDGSLTPTSHAGNSNADDIAFAPNGTAYLVSSGAGGVYPIDVTTRTAGTLISVAATNGARHGIAVFPDGLSFITLVGSNVAGEQIVHISLTQNPPVRYVRWGFPAPDTTVDPGGVAISGRGDILFTAKAAAKLHDWTGAQFHILSPAFNAQVARLVIERAH